MTALHSVNSCGWEPGTQAREADMPSAKRFAILRETVRNHPVVTATTAATRRCFAGRVRGRSAARDAADHSLPARRPRRLPLETKAAPKPAPAETTGSAPAGESVLPRTATGRPGPTCRATAWRSIGTRIASARGFDGQARQADRRERTAPPADEGKLAAPAVWAPSVALRLRRPLRRRSRPVSVPPQAPLPAAGAVASPAPPAAAPPIKL